jgi:O-antigen biosynthesis protein
LQPMKLSVIIVNYNVRHFLEQCLHSVLKASAGLTTEIIVVDNASVDGSCHMIRGKFPMVRLIENKKNLGFSAANNQAIRESSGKFLLLLNPDTVVEESTFTKSLEFMEAHPDAGALGVKMIDGKGKFLPESKRGLPTPWVAFYRIFGLSALFPRSKAFGKYHLTYLDENETSGVDVLCGAYMMIRRKTLDQTGLLDESFFMYGEDIDLSYRILQAGYKNYYFPGTTIIHYKGESTRKNSINYVKVFYNAMNIFARKHFSSGNARIFSLFIHLAIWFRAFIAISRRFLSRIILPLADAVLIFGGFALLIPFWERIRHQPGYYPDFYLQWVVPCYLLFWLAGILLSGGYRKPVSLYRLERGLLWGTVALLLVYSLIPENLRFSRAMILAGSVWSLGMLPLARFLFRSLHFLKLESDARKSRRTAIAGHLPAVSRVREMLDLASAKPEIIGYVSLSDTDTGGEYLGTLERISDIVKINRIEEIIFCAGDVRSHEIISAMLELADSGAEIKIAPPDTLSIIGSHSIHTAGDLYHIDLNAVNRNFNKKVKRLFDVTVVVLLLLFIWIEIWLVKNRKFLMRNIGEVFLGRKSWVGYIPPATEEHDLPPLKQGVLHPGMLFRDVALPGNRIRQLNVLYAKDYSVWNDAELVFLNLKKLDHDGTN